ncbi:GrpB family protein [Paenibacillus sp. PFR10]|uniref:GrpB family protein n=1 Tax=Paenibacillus violae TaxID=3077234 RepID=A0ABU3R9D4_9BACL|nr:GrpB family protein [Paenibacillus sp. PFR10]MDU0200876.1 GrpB family protein [Paenibacillus sp. PFR10]
MAVRDYLRTHPDEVNCFGALKESLAKQFPRDIEAYMDGKDAFVNELESKALNWYNKRGTLN